jgi:hypothetical protein
MGVVKKIMGGDSSESQRSWKRRLWQQDYVGNSFPLWFYSHHCQVWCNLFLGAVLLTIGIVYLALQQSILELAVPYDHSTKSHTFTLNDNWPGPVFVYYEIENFHAPYRSFVESKDHFIVGSGFSKYNCEGASTRAQALKIRPGDEVFAKLTEGLSEIRPCGLVAFSFFLDRFELYRRVNASVESEGDTKDYRLLLDETDIAIEGDREHFRRKIINSEEGAPTVDDMPIFLHAETEAESAALMEHFIVWYRGASSSRFRNLWARINGGRPAGTYSWVFQNHSEVWTKWGVNKKVVLTTSTDLGNNNKFLGACFIFAGVAMLGVSLAFRSPPGGAGPESGDNLSSEVKEALQEIARQRYARSGSKRSSELIGVVYQCPNEEAENSRGPGAAW